MAQGPNDFDKGALTKAFERLDEHHADIAGIKSDVSGVKKDVGTLVDHVRSLGSEIKQLNTSVTGQVASRGPGLMEIVNGALAIALFVGAMATGVGIYVSATYSGPMADTSGRLAKAEAALDKRDADDRAELTRLRLDDRLALGERLKAIEDRFSWGARTSVAPNP